MSQFSDQIRKTEQTMQDAIAAMADQRDSLVHALKLADDQADEQTTAIFSMQQTIKLLQEEIERISQESQEKIDARDAEITALRSRLGQKDKDFAVLSRAIGAIQASSQHIVATATHAFNVIRRDSVGDKIVTQLRRPQPPGPNDSMHEILRRASGD